ESAETETVEAKPRLNLTGPMKAALWLLSCDEELAIEITARLNRDDLKILRDAVQSLDKVRPEDLAAIHQELAQLANTAPMYLRGHHDYFTKLAERAFGSDRARRLLADESEPIPESERLSQVSADVLATVLREQHPQVTAAVLAVIEPESSSAVLNQLEGPERIEIVTRIARLSKIPHESIKAVARTVTDGFGLDADLDSEVDGSRLAAQLLNRLGEETADSVISEMSNTDEALATQLRRAMFTFEDLSKVDKRGFQALLKEVPQSKLIVALKTASEDIRELVFGSLSKRAAEMLRDDLDSQGPMRLSEVEEAQEAILEIAISMRDSGKLMIAGQGEDEFI
ncbi:MAG: FliG C-terminal domain-containing protein, partial [Myxococcota bacterium]